MRFDYLEPSSVQEAISLLSRHDGKARIIAGGTDLLVQIRSKKIQAEYVVDVGNLAGLDYIDYDARGGLKIGALTTVRTVEKSPVLRETCPVLSQAAGQLASRAIRNVATIGGNLCNAAPSAENAPGLIALGAQVKIVGPDGERVVLLEDFFLGPGKTVLKTGELLTEIQVPPLASNTTGAYLKHSIRGSIDLAIVGVAAVVTMENDVCRDVKIVLGAVAPTPLRARAAEEVLRGKRIDSALIDKASAVASGEALPISDVRGSAEYRREMVKVFTRRAVSEAVGS